MFPDDDEENTSEDTELEDSENEVDSDSDSTEEEEDTNDPDADSDDENASLVVNGKYLGRYDSEAEAVKAIRNRESQYGRQARELGSLRKLAQQNGWQVNRDGTVTPPSAKRAGDTETDASPKWAQDSDGTRYATVRNPDGSEVHIDETGARYYTDDERDAKWNEIAEKYADPATGEYDTGKVQRVYTDWITREQAKAIQHRTQRIGTLSQQHLQERDTVRNTFITSVSKINPAATTVLSKAFDELNQRIDAAPNREQFLQPGAYENVAKVFMADAIIRLANGETLDDTEDEGEGEEEAPPVRQPKGRTTQVTPESPGPRRPAPQKAQQRYTITPEIAKAAEDYGVDPQKVAAEYYARAGKNGRR